MSEKPEKPHKSSDEILTELSHKIEVEKQARTTTEEKEPDHGRALGMRIASDFFAGIFFGVLVGYYMDQWLDTAPFAMIIMTFLGFGAGIRNAMRSSEEFAQRTQERRARDEKQQKASSPQKTPSQK